VPEGIALHEIIYAESTPVDYVVLDANPTYEDTWGMRQVPVSVGQKASDVYKGSDIPYLEIYAEVAMSGNPTAFEITDRLLGTTFYVSVFSPTQGQFATLVRDITQRKRMEEKQQKLIAVLENSDDFIGLVTFEGQSFYVNAAGRKMLGMEGNGQFVHTAFFEYFKPEDLPHIRQQVLPTVVEEGEWEGRLNFRDVASGIDIPVYCNIFVVKDTNNQTDPPLGLGIIGRSMDKHRRMVSIHETDTNVAPVSKVPLIPVAPLVGSLEATTVKTSEQTKALAQALLAGIREQQATCASKLVVLDIAGLETTLEALAALGTQTTLSHAMTEALEKLGIDVDPLKTQSQG
jgi:PAS domain-containing protein